MAGVYRWGMTMYVVEFSEIGTDATALVGGKGANLGRLVKLPGLNVPDGFCVTTDAYRGVVAADPAVGQLLAGLAEVTSPDPEAIAGPAATLRDAIEHLTLPADLVDEIERHLARLPDGPVAVRSSATAEDLPQASFAGQQDTYLNVVGADEVIRAVARCWASLFTDSAVAYRITNGFPHDAVALSVVIQAMVSPQSAGIMFTADPITGNRKVVSIDAGFGLGESLVSGLVTADNYRVRDGAIVSRRIAAKATETALTDDQAVRLAALGRRIEAHFGRPQDIEWALADGQPVILQARPITTLYPVPEPTDDKNHVYMSFNHQQMMTDAMKPLGLSFMQAAESTLVPIGGRLYMEMAHDLATPSGRALARPALKLMDPLVASAVDTLLERKDFVKNLARGKKFLSMGSGYFSWAMVRETVKGMRHPDPAIVPRLIAAFEHSARDLDARLERLEGPALLEQIKQEYAAVGRAISAPESMATVWVGTMTANWLNKRGKRWLGEKGLADSLVQSVPYNNTSQMGLDLLDVADAIRDHPAVTDYLEHPSDKTFFDDLQGLPGGDVAVRAIRDYLDKYGVRCPGEIDITRPRWNEQPGALAPMILDNIRHTEPGAHAERYERGLAEYARTREDILTRLGRTSARARKTAEKIDTLRAFSGFREYPKHAMMLSYWAIKRALLREADALVRDQAIADRDDIFFLTLDEVSEVVRTRRADAALIASRKAGFEVFKKLTPPRVMTSEGEILTGTYTSRTPPGALAGIAASAGVVEGRARVVRRLEDIAATDGDILVTTYTDPSWTPVFVAVRGLVTEVGGVATHGSVIAREYGLPAVVGVEDATNLIHDGRRIRVNGTEGWVQLL